MTTDTNKPATAAGPASTWRAPDRTGMRYPEQSDLSGGATNCAPAPAVDEWTADSDSVDLAAASNGSPGGAWVPVTERMPASGVTVDAIDEWDKRTRPAPLSDEQIRALGRNAFGIDIAFDGHLMQFARAIERELFEGE